MFPLAAAMLTGEIQVEGDPGLQPLKRGDTMLLPASLGKVALEPTSKAQLLDIYLP